VLRICFLFFAVIFQSGEFQSANPYKVTSERRIVFAFWRQCGEANCLSFSEHVIPTASALKSPRLIALHMRSEGVIPSRPKCNPRFASLTSAYRAHSEIPRLRRVEEIVTGRHIHSGPHPDIACRRCAGISECRREHEEPRTLNKIVSCTSAAKVGPNLRLSDAPRLPDSFFGGVSGTLGFRHAIPRGTKSLEAYAY
jgi:hypothetical protein